MYGTRYIGEVFGNESYGAIREREDTVQVDDTPSCQVGAPMVNLFAI
jgi:hypothetical protein